MEVNYLQNIKETHTLSLQTIVDLQSLRQDRESEIANLKMDNAKLGLELSKIKDEAVALKVKNKNLEEEKNTLETKLDDNKAVLKKAKPSIAKLNKELEKSQSDKKEKED